MTAPVGTHLNDQEDDHQEGMEKGTLFKDVHEAIQVHIWHKFRAGGDRDDSACAYHHEGDGRGNDVQEDVLLFGKEAPGKSSQPYRGRSYVRGDQGYDSPGQDLWRLCDEGLGLDGRVLCLPDRAVNLQPCLPRLPGPLPVPYSWI